MTFEQWEQQYETVTTKTTERNQHKMLSVGELRFEIDVRSDGPPCCCCCYWYCFMLFLSCNCHWACATTDESWQQQQQQQQQQYYTVPTPIKRLMITKILNNLCRFICLFLLLLLCNWSFIEKTHVMQWAHIFKWSVHWAKMYNPPLINHRSMEHHYIKWVLHIAEYSYT